MKFIEQATESPIALDMNEKELPLPEPGINEHRKYFNHRTFERTEIEADGQESIVIVPVADYVSAANATIPNDEEWTACLSEAGYGSEQIAVILSGGTL